MENYEQPPEQTEITLRIGETALEVLHTPSHYWQSDGDDRPPIALVALAEDIYTLGGKDIEKLSESRGAKLLAPDELDVTDVRPPAEHGCVKLLLGKASLEALTVPRSVMDGFVPPVFGLVNFSEVWRMAGDMVADHIVSQGAREIRGSQLDADGNDMTGENHFN
jgi:hypothetical protein